MKVKSIHLENIGCFSELKLQLAPTAENTSNTTIIIGNNGAGKSTILESIAISLSWFVSRVRYEKGSGSPISELKIKNDTSAAAISIELENGERTFKWILAKTRVGKKSEKVSKLDELSRLVNDYKERYTSDNNVSFPLMIFYDANRGVLDVPLKIRGKHTFQQLDGYDNSLNGIVDYRRFFEWYREREDFENETRSIFLDNFNQNNFKSYNIEKNNSLFDRQLTAVRTAITTFLPGFEKIRIVRKPRLHMAIDKDGKTLNVEQLSQGEKLLMSLVGDIARRLAMMNPLLDNALEGNGIILIDEAELHLHPKWQRTLISRLSTTFPNCQFILSTHSPLVISDYKEVLCYSLNDGELLPVNDLFGLDVNQVLIEAMNTDIRNAEIDTKINLFLEKIQERKLDEAKVILKNLENDLPESHIELIKSRLLIKRLTLQSETNK
jgi:predicted ATP-binding protein involved in virulence